MGIHQYETGRTTLLGHSSNIAATARRHPVALAALIALLGAAPLVAMAAPPERSAEGPWAKGRILVMPKPGLSAEKMAKMLHGGKATKIGGSNLHIVELPASASEKAVAALMEHNPHFEFAELDMFVQSAATANDPYMGSAWHLPKIGATTAWDTTHGSSVTIAILDTGVDGSHPDLAARMVPGYNFYSNNTDTRDVHGHGTGVAGAAAASTNNSVGVSSVAGHAKIMPVRIADPSAWATWSTVAKGVTWAADRGARIANISYHGVAGSSTIRSAADYMRSKGGLVFAAAGNNNKDEGFAQTNSIISVSATNTYDQKSSFSSWGSFVQMSAPGEGIWTTVRGGTYQTWKGTSIATPVTAATAALMMAANPSLSAYQIEKLLFSTALDLGAAGRDSVFGYGRVDAAKAVRAAVTAVAPTADTQAPSTSISAPLGSSTVSGLVPVSVTATDNVGVAKVELRVNGSVYATDSSAPFAFSWDSTKVSNGSAALEAVAFDAVGNSAKSTPVTVNVSNISTTTIDTTAPANKILNPTNGAKVNGSVAISVSATDDSGASSISQQLFIGGKLVKTITGGTLSYTWNARKATTGAYLVEAIARDAAGNVSKSSVQVYR